MMVPKQLANTMEFILERSIPTIGAAAVIVIGPPAKCTNPQNAGRYDSKSMQAACRTDVPSSIPVRDPGALTAPPAPGLAWAKTIRRRRPAPRKTGAFQISTRKSHLDDRVLGNLEEIGSPARRSFPSASPAASRTTGDHFKAWLSSIIVCATRGHAAAAHAAVAHPAAHSSHTDGGANTHGFENDAWRWAGRPAFFDDDLLVTAARLLALRRRGIDPFGRQCRLHLL